VRACLLFRIWRVRSGGRGRGIDHGNADASGKIDTRGRPLETLAMNFGHYGVEEAALEFSNWL